MFGAELGVVFLYSAIIMLVFLFAWILIVPFKLLKKIALNVIVGIVCIMLYNYIGATTGGYGSIGINLITTGVVGALGIPGFVAIIVIKAIL
ncbi:pro-sigmaK processing inhibitor BofA family protein [Sedimentibacter sp. zth1]|uniref:pro-sigmaK processing inhibitor BofA family protein n=1 Tax=Sedimentibacter sp. zth1 TaxID=2816908 RepID=UPI001A93297E|nr:pro-sigmaK processing inhibitor BofA family protein [Sedimentibacter sp. zth1]QSX05829.1 pro-sigmaK processing inhibitor BofA family protein [Sedimentibacter sp. zth1]